MSGERCANCGRPDVAHLDQGRCPQGLTVNINADALDRLSRSGHPRLLKLVLAGEQQGAFGGVTIENIRVIEDVR